MNRKEDADKGKVGEREACHCVITPAQRRHFGRDGALNKSIDEICNAYDKLFDEILGAEYKDIHIRLTHGVSPEHKTKGF